MKASKQSKLRMRRQWIIGLSSDPNPTEWQSMPLTDSLELSLHPDLQVEALNKSDELILVLGQLVRTETSPPDHTTIISGRDALIDWLEGAAGVYVVVRVCGRCVEVFTDPAGIMGVYYKDGRAASSPSLLPGFEWNEHMRKEYPLRGTDDWFTGSLTPFLGISYLMANHSLDVISGTVVRFWPRNPVAKTSLSQGIATAASIMRTIVHQVSKKRGNILLSLTGGKDSRVNLAAAREVLDEVNCFTLRGKGVKKSDLSIPANLAKRFDFTHCFVDIPPCESWLTEIYDEISGGIAIGARRDILSACLHFEDRDAIHLSGNLGAIAKAYYWRSANPEPFARSLLVRDFINLAPCIEHGVDEWVASLPSGLSAGMIYNLMYLEQRGGRWTGVGENASSIFYQPFSAFNSREFFLALCQVPDKDQFCCDLHEELIAYLWPELLEVPFTVSSRNLFAFMPKGFKDLIKKFIGRR